MTPENIKKTVGRYFGISEHDMESKTRKREVVTARQIGMALMDKYTHLSLKRIGAMYGGRDHSTVIHARDTVSDLCCTDKKYARNFDKLDEIVGQNKDNYTKVHCRELIGYDILEQNNKHLPI